MAIDGCRWVFKVKYHADGTIEPFLSLHYTETFSTVKPAIIRLVLALDFSRNWSLKQFNVQNTFLNGILQEDVFMIQPPGFTDPLKPGYVCKLHRAFYGFKQPPRAWYLRLPTFLTANAFCPGQCDASLFIQKTSTQIFLY